MSMMPYGHSSQNATDDNNLSNESHIRTETDAYYIFIAISTNAHNSLTALILYYQHYASIISFERPDPVTFLTTFLDRLMHTQLRESCLELGKIVTEKKLSLVFIAIKYLDPMIRNC